MNNEEKPEVDLRVRYIYLYTNKITGRRYVGQTLEIEKRHNSHLSDGRTKGGEATLFDQKLFEYGENSFNREIIGMCYGEKLAKKLENFYIKELKTMAHENGYNMKWGGLSRSRGKSTKQKMANLLQGISRKGSRFIGVIQKRGQKSFTARVRVNKILRSKAFPLEREAAEAYDKMVLKIYGEGAKLNFSEKRDKYLSENLDKFYELFLKKSIIKKSKFKYVKKNSFGRWRVTIRKALREMVLLDLIDLESEVEAAALADKIYFYYYNYPAEKLNFPEKVEEFISKDLEKIISGYIKPKGYVSFDKKQRVWRAGIRFDGKQIYSGSFSTCEEAENGNLLMLEMLRNDPLYTRPRSRRHSIAKCALSE